MKIRRFIVKRRRRAAKRQRRINDRITQLHRQGLQVITVNDVADLAKLRSVGGQTIIDYLDRISCPPHDLELIGQRGPEVGIWRCRKCGVELS